ncbi:MAG: M81 family metallopeptidase [Pseudomonadota bacterium]
MAPRVALLGMVLESNRWARPASRADFERLTWLEDSALLEAARAPVPSISRELAAFVGAMDATGPWTPVPCFFAASHPAGPVEETVFEDALSRMEVVLGSTEPVDAVLIVNHGAMTATHDDDPDGTLASRIRAAAPDAVIVMTLDLHANISPAMVSATDLIVGYRTNPHVDMIERGEEAAFSLRRILASGTRPVTALVTTPITPPSLTLLTAAGPYGAMIDLGQRRQAEMSGEILNVSIFGNFIFSDTRHNALSIVVAARRDGAAAEALASELAQLAWGRRQEFQRALTPVADAVALSLASDRAPMIFSDAGDNPGGGGSGRTTELLTALHSAGAERVLYGSFFDPALAAQAHSAGLGAQIEARFNADRGAQSWERWDTPFTASADVLALGDGKVVGRRGITAGREMDLGPTAALRIGGIDVVVISDRAQTADPVFFEMLGLDVGAAHTVVVKSRGHFREGFGPWFSPDRVIEVDTEGLTSPVLSRWEFEGLPRPSFPLDQDTTWPDMPSP